MSLISVLKTVGKDLSHVGGWIDDGLKIVQPVASAFDPALGSILLIAENALNNLPAGVKVTSDLVQKIVTAAATVAGAGGVTAPSACPCVNCPMKVGVTK